MRRVRLALAFLALAVLPSAASHVSAEDAEEVPAALDFEMHTLAGEPVHLKQYLGRVVLFVNVASQCGLTPQYEGLEALHEKYAEHGLSIVGVPANEFGAQEPGTNLEIAEFCRSNYNVQFDMLSKVVVKGEGICPLYQFLTSQETNPDFCGPITWNFEKFLVNRHGEVVARFAPKIEPTSDEVVQAIEAALAQE